MQEAKKIKLLQMLMSTHKHNDEPIIFPPGQQEIYRAIVLREHKRVQITCCTQYGKTHTIGVACLPATCIQRHKVCILAPTNDKAKLIMRDYVDHLGDNPLYYEELEQNTKLDRLRMEENKSRIMLKRGGGIYVISLQANNSNKSFAAAMGEGADTVILDEGALIQDDTEATVYRMIAGQGAGAMYVKVGNPFTTGHFKKTHDDPRYYKINIDYKQALAEGRYMPEFIEEAKTRPMFDVLYANQFPKESMVDGRGFRRLLNPAEITACVDINEQGNPSIDIPAELEKYKNRQAEIIELKKQKAKLENLQTPEPFFKGKPRLGSDIGRGNNRSTHILRFNNYAIIVNKNQSSDLMDQVPIIRNIKTEYYVDDNDINVDDTGVGGGVVDRLHELGDYVNGVRTGEPAVENDKYANQRAELSFMARDWLVNEKGQIAPAPLESNIKRYSEQDNWPEQLKIPKYKENSSSKLIMESKQDLAKQGVDSPDDWDALCLTFSSTPNVESSDFDII